MRHSTRPPGLGTAQGTGSTTGMAGEHWALLGTVPRQGEGVCCGAWVLRAAVPRWVLSASKSGWHLPAAAQPGSAVCLSPALTCALPSPPPAPHHPQAWDPSCPPHSAFTPSAPHLQGVPFTCRGSPPPRREDAHLASCCGTQWKGQVAAAWQRLWQSPLGRLAAAGGFWRAETPQTALHVAGARLHGE